MQNAILQSFSLKYKNVIEEQLAKSIEELQAPALIKEAMHYSLDAGGKRIRPLLVFAVLKAFGHDPRKGLMPACAIEMIHTYSLIHDDLPSMDNDDLRRGIPTNHKVFGEATAILSGDALLTYSFQLIASDETIPIERRLAIVLELAKAAGAEGMVGGQIADMQGEGKQLTLKELEYIHVHKTGKLLIGSVKIGALLAKANEKQKDILSEFAYHLGLAFQIRDDILDLEGDQSLIGKPVGSDESNHKNTYPSILTMQGAKETLSATIEHALHCLKQLDLDTSLLEEITYLVASRNH
ncbi:polyprenyl synthetase family protein [Bacillus sp. 03113]|uniref:polyprenyl synthetase family protein n=1 Tax=Bacillus sp. 03113 TaxID=2578211 RepID=UPI00114435F7|nr:farnesyl diphosphate synthase [Bacillus sp. 03113]